MSCPCDSGKTYTTCCEPFLTGQDYPETIEKLMRSRYTAFTKVEMDYILETHDPKTRNETDMDANREWAETANWQGLEILDVAHGGPKDQEGFIEFKAFYAEGDGDDVFEHHEVGEFVKRQGKWYFHDGQDLNQETYVREEPKVGRNEPCSCGSGKKFKKCCGAN